MFTAQDVMKLREITGVGMMDCKKALIETDGNMDKAVEYLREKGIATAAKKSSRIAAEGTVDCYIHMGGKVGVMIEVNCETDFVGRSDKFKEFVHDLTLQIAAYKPSVIRVEELDPADVENERKIAREQIKNDPKLANKPENVINNIIEGRLNNYYKEVVLLEQTFCKDPSKTIKQYLNETIASIGEKIDIRRFVRYEMGEGLEKRQNNLADEVSEQIAKLQK